MRRVALFTTIMLTFTPATAEESCYDKVEIGDPQGYVIERCGEPVRREREIGVPSKSVEVIRGSNTLVRHPEQSQMMEKWYYDTSLDTATLIEIQDGGVLDKRRLEREPVNTVPME